ncbi:MAG: GNAT family N-acetyltransferase [Clostridia bacterium]|nr:GNAT family N-acetyltransferase [Clostridia bacterium]
MTRYIINVKPNLTDENIFELLAPSTFNPTPEKLHSRAAAYKYNERVHAYAYLYCNQYVGIVVFETYDNHATVLDIAVNKAYREMGFGTRLINSIFENFKIDTLTAETDDEAVNFYLKCGFKIVKTKTSFNTKRYVCKKELNF